MVVSSRETRPPRFRECRVEKKKKKKKKERIRKKRKMKVYSFKMVHTILSLILIYNQFLNTS